MVVATPYIAGSGGMGIARAVMAAKSAASPTLFNTAIFLLGNNDDRICFVEKDVSSSFADCKAYQEAASTLLPRL